MTAADLKELAAKLEAIAAALATAEERTDESSKVYGERAGNPAAGYAHQVGALGFIAMSAAEDIRAIIARDLARRRGNK